MTRGLLRDGLPPALAALGAVLAVAAVLTGLRGLQSSGAPDPATWAWLVLLAIPVALPIAAPAAGVVGVVAALSRWVEEGAWAGARASGVAGRRLIPGALIAGAVAAMLAAAATGWAEPAARRAGRRAAGEALSELVLWPGQVTEIEGVALRPERVERGVAQDVFLAAGDLVGAARSAAIADGQVVLGAGTLASTTGTPWRVSWSRWTRPLPDLAAPRIELAERSNAELAAVVERTEGAGRDASYERAVLHKRWLHPLAVALLPLALLPFGARGRPALGLGLAAVGYLVAVRAGDHASAWIGGFGGAAFGVVYVVAVGAAAWAAWRDR